MREKNPNIEFVTSTNIIIVVGKGNSAPIKISEKIDIKLITIQKLTNAFFEKLIFLFLLGLPGLHKLNNDKKRINSSAAGRSINNIPNSLSSHSMKLIIKRVKRKHNMRLEFIKKLIPSLKEGEFRVEAKLLPIFIILLIVILISL
ncbi:hypothetical protein GLV94_12505 [Virgibacillus halodenitrificans]|uniref:hypothetical protein n=1 Tax=Virgibacillus halodenitrificans TaxID=1482 RepID=UPI00136F4FD8|nr:hypothetical protein [Virgibacillus halodenitrificans]MYL46464.1 hypothetical protein [Virgibacillus halodenitrificans]